MQCVHPKCEPHQYDTTQTKVTKKWDAEWTHPNQTNDDIEKTITALVQHNRITPQKDTYTIKGTANEKDIENISPQAMRISAHRFAAWIKERHISVEDSKNMWVNIMYTHLINRKCICQDQHQPDCEERKMINAPEHIHKLAKRLIDADFQMDKNSYNTDPESHFSSQGHYCKAGDEDQDKEHLSKFSFYSPTDEAYSLVNTLDHILENSQTAALGLVKDTALNRSICTEKNAAIIAVIRPYQLKLTPAPILSKSPVQRTMQGVQHIIILNVGTDTKFDKDQVIIRYHALKEWKEKFCPKATILEHNLAQELSKDRDDPIWKTIGDDKEWGTQQKAAWIDKAHSDKGILTKTASKNMKSMGASEDFIRTATQGMATSRIQNLITNKTLKDAAIEKMEISQLVARWKLTKEKVGADNGLFKIKSGLGV